MTRVRTLWAVALVATLGIPTWAAQTPEDPVLQARALRAQARGISEDDLPPVPRSIVEPPPLPPPELHPRDQRGSRAARAARKGGRGRSTKAVGSRKARTARGSRAKRSH